MESSNYFSEKLFPHHDSASLVNVHLVKGELPIYLEVNQEVKSDSTTISPSLFHEVNHNIFQVLQSKKLNCIIFNDISRNLLLEKLSLIPSGKISYAALYKVFVANT